jgi:uncharacterized protein involved in exopolysaccharide biosynthesis
VSNTLSSSVKENHNPHYNNNTDKEEILWRILWGNKLIIIIISLLFTSGSVFYALSKPNIYVASALLAPAASESGAGGLSGLASQFGGLASVAGINLGGSTTDNTTLAIEIIRSRSFIEKFIEKHNLLVPLIAANGWDIKSKKLLLNNEIYDESNKQWIRQAKLPKKTIPSNWEGYKKFLDILIVSQSEKTSMINISLEFYSPQLAQQWLTWLIEDINEFMSSQDKKEAQASIDYLNEKLASIQVSNMETVFYQLIEEQTKNMMLAHIKPEYVFKTIDPAQVPDEKSKPKRALIVIIGTLLGGVFSILLVLVRFYLK